MWDCNGSNGGISLVCSLPISGAGENNITSLTGGYDGNIVMQMACSISTAGGTLEVYDMNSTRAGSSPNVPCGPAGSSFTIRGLPLIEDQIYQVVLTIPAPCGVCKKEAFVTILSTSSSTKGGAIVPDNSPTLAVLVSLLAALFIMRASSKKK